MLAVLLKIISTVLSIIIVIVGEFGFWTPQINSLNTVTKVADGFYTMDYTYDYDVDEMLERGIPTHVDLVAYGAYNVFSDYKGFGCTTFNSVNEDGEYLFSRNFDYMDMPYLLVWTHPSNGYASISSVSLYFLLYSEKFAPDNQFQSLLTLLAPYCPLDGINEKGLSIGVLELEREPLFQISEKSDLTTTTVIRAVLDKCATVEEAIEMFDSHDIRDFLFGDCTYHYQIADAYGNSAVIEYVDGKMNVLRPEKKIKSKTDYIAAANFYLVEGVSDPDGMGYERIETVYSALDKCRGCTSEEEAMDILESVSMKDADLHGYICSTLWSTVYNTNDLTVDICVNTDYDTVYKFGLSSPQKIINR